MYWPIEHSHPEMSSKSWTLHSTRPFWTGTFPSQIQSILVLAARPPLWIISFWRRVWELKTLQDLWGQASKWLANKINEAEDGKRKQIFT